MIIDIHNHTPLCKHAVGDPEEYAQKAFENGIKIYGFSDHAPMNFDTQYRMSFEQMSEYENKIKRLKEKYNGKMQILLGYEVDFIPNLIDDRVLSRNVDYLIGSVHFIDEWGFDNPEFIGEYKNKNIDDIWQKYFDCIEQMAKYQKFDIVGHLDLLKVFKFLPKTDIRILCKNALKAIKKSNMVVEINSSGLRKPISEIYPSKTILEQIFDLDIDITFGSDAHKPEDVCKNLQECYNLAKSVGYDKCVSFYKREKTTIKF